MKRMAQGMTQRLLTLLAAFTLLAPSLTYAQRVEYYHVDALGSVRAVTDEQGDVIERHDYLPFGEEWNPEPSSQPRKFTGKERDQETGWDYFGARYYEASLARFTSIDPVITFDENRVDPQRWNRYAYVRNNPMRYVDPDGKAVTVAAILALGWAAFEIGSQIYDAYSTVETLADPEISARDKALVAGLFVAGAIAPGGGYSSAAKATLGKADNVAPTIGQLRRSGQADAHHIIQDAAVRDLPGYSSNAAPGLRLPGPAGSAGTAHNIATRVQRRAGGGTYAAERRIGYRAARRAGVSKEEARDAIRRADEYFESIGVTGETRTRIPGNRPSNEVK